MSDYDQSVSTLDQLTAEQRCTQQLQSQLAALKLENEKLVELAVGAKLFAQHHHSCACLFGFGLRPCTCGLTALRAEIERVKETKEQQKP